MSISRPAFAAGSRPGMGHHVVIAGMREYLEDHGQRYSVLLDVAGAFAERGMIESAREVAAVIGAIRGGDDAIWKARALIDIAVGPPDDQSEPVGFGGLSLHGRVA